MFRKISKAEGRLACWKGLIPAVMAVIPRRGIKFLSFEQYKRLAKESKNGNNPLVRANTVKLVFKLI